MKTKMEKLKKLIMDNFDDFSDIMDKYYAKKCTNMICSALNWTRVDKKVKEEKDCFVILIKKPREEERYYEVFDIVHFYNSFEQYMNTYSIKNNQICESAIELLKKKR